MLTGSEIRRKFLDYFVQNGHREVHSSSLVPANDPTLLFTNAGMNQFKDVFLGLEKRDYKRATTSQKCVRAGGKHNDLENVGFTNRHHTFFEMLGNFSFGDYFKKDAIAYAWELITSKTGSAIDKDKLYVTIFEGAGRNRIAARRRSRRSLARTGRAQRTNLRVATERQFLADGRHRPLRPLQRNSLRHGSSRIRKWTRRLQIHLRLRPLRRNLESRLHAIRPRRSGKLNPLPKPSIDTGMGLERLTAVLQGVISNYDTDLFTPLIKRAAELTGSVRSTKELEKEAKAKSAASLRVIADHSRAATFLISDGVLPSNEGRGYVLRKIIGEPSARTITGAE